MSEKKLKSIDVTSFTVISTGVSTLISILIAIVFIGMLAVSVPNSLGIMIYLVPSIVFGTMITSIFLYFSEAYLYNTISKRFGYVTFDIENGCINKISTRNTALIAAVITLVISLVVYLAFSFIASLLLSSVITVLMYASQTGVASLIYELMFVVSNPIYMIIGIISTTIITSVFVLLATYIYNLLGTSERGIHVELSENDGFSILDSIDPLSFGIAIGAIILILNIIVGAIMIISGSAMFSALTSILISFIIAFIECIIIAVVYNFLAPKIGKLKVELI